MRTSWRQMVRPSPVPPKRRVMDASACEKAWKMPCSCSGAMPMPLSCTSKHSSGAAPGLAPSGPGWQRTRTTTSPCAVNLMALPTRLMSTWRSRVASPCTCSGTSGAMSMTSSSPFSAARVATLRQAAATVARSASGSRSSVSLPASILEKSRMSLRMASSDSADCCTMCRYWRCTGCSGVPSTSCVRPMMPFMGVRTSWLMLATNSLLARLACSAASVAWRCAASVALRAVMSRNAVTEPVTCAPWRSGLLATSTASVEPSARENTSSPRNSPPWCTTLNTGHSCSGRWSLRAWEWKMSCPTRPSTSSGRSCSISNAAGFISVTWPWLSSTYRPSGMVSVMALRLWRSCASRALDAVSRPNSVSISSSPSVASAAETANSRCSTCANGAGL